MGGHYSWPRSAERDRRMDRLLTETDANTKAEVLDMATKHLKDSLENAQGVDTGVCHSCKLEFNTSVIKHRTTTETDVKRP